MHALLVELEIDAGQSGEAIKFLHDVAVPMISKGQGFINGTWMRSEDGRHTRSLMIYESLEAAKAAAERAAEGPPPGAPTKFVSAEVFEVMAQA
jgi:hypothetical protein